MSKIEQTVCDEIDSLENLDENIRSSMKSSIKSRCKAGEVKYGVTLERDDLSELEWLNHLQEELLDALNYATRIQAISDAHAEEQFFHELKGYLFYFTSQLQKSIELEKFYGDEDETDLHA